MKVTESYGKGTVEGCRDDTKAGLSFLVISDFPSESYSNFYLTKRKSVKKMLRIHHSNLFHIRRSFHLISRYVKQAPTQDRDRDREKRQGNGSAKP